MSESRFCVRSGAAARLSSLEKLKLLALILLSFCCHAAVAGEFRYNLMVTTGLQERVFDKDGSETTIIFSKKSDEEARFLLTKILELGGINGTKGMERRNGVPFEQAILLKGRLDPVVRRTASSPNTAAAEDYQVFLLEEVRIRFPLVRHRPGRVFDTAYLETHFSFDTLFPDGLDFEGQKIDFTRYTARSEQGRADQPVTRTQSKPEGNENPKTESKAGSQ